MAIGSAGAGSAVRPRASIMSMDSPFFVPDLVRQFCHYLYRHIRERNVAEVESMYVVSYKVLGDRYYKTTPWPQVELIADVVDQDHVFCLLYKVADPSGLGPDLGGCVSFPAFGSLYAPASIALEAVPTAGGGRHCLGLHESIQQASNIILCYFMQICLQELYFRHLYARGQPDLRQRCESCGFVGSSPSAFFCQAAGCAWGLNGLQSTASGSCMAAPPQTLRLTVCSAGDNYIDLFGLLLHSNVNMQLPNIWLWDMIDEFIYQFQARAKWEHRAHGIEDSLRIQRCQPIMARAQDQPIRDAWLQLG